MISLFGQRKCGPIGVDLGSRWLKLAQFDAPRQRPLQAFRFELPPRPEDKSAQHEILAEALRDACSSQEFRGRDVVLCLGPRELFIQNIRVPRSTPEQLPGLVNQEIAGRLPFKLADAEVRFIDAGEVRQGEFVKREVIVLACQRSVLHGMLDAIVAAGLRPLAVDVEPAALVRCFARSMRREEDRRQTMLLVHAGATCTLAVICREEQILFAKYIDVGGQHLDESVARSLKMRTADASQLRRHRGERRSGRHDPEVAATVASAARPVIEKLAIELSLCLRYHSVTFRGQPLERVVLAGGEATPDLVDALHARLGLPCELGDPWRGEAPAGGTSNAGQWDVAIGLALREVRS